MKDHQLEMLKTFAVLSAVFFLIVLLIQWLVAPDYKTDIHQVLEESLSEKNVVYPSEFADILKSSTTQQYIIIDLRRQDEFSRDSFPGSINLPFEKLSESGILKQLKRYKKTILLLSDSEARSAAAFIFLQSKGIGNVRYVSNDYLFVKNYISEPTDQELVTYGNDKARYDFTQFFKVPVTPIPVKIQTPLLEDKPSRPKGGC